ncbi:RNA polymerase sigma-70 factor (ECF subfamily) [Desulfitobacterium sp. LBE]|uniref:ECF RNA polymerase sigma factor SigH n=1 Tax=bioreactor metagenome TaxID=1076179 RepID=A0A644UB05_9ZZZZ|nr:MULTISPECIES: RNA polymerase sigma factor [Desulfitobacterium]MEA5022201.1 RNA polymerase sigma factor [Desulfitobacterium hafniense]TWH59532.1 RNA polymerase sigma-70 factor (ECF subfamily) [Desulfitobacterium sp. LBE]
MSMQDPKFTELYQENYPKVFSFLLNATNDPVLTEDLVQETFIRALNKLDTFRHEASIIVWLNRIGYNLFLDHVRKKNPILIDDFEGQVIAEDSSAEEVEQKLMSECIRSKIQLLRENYRTPLYLDINGYSNQEIAEILNCSLDNAKIRLHRAKKKIKEILDDDCNMYYDERNVLCCSQKK